MHTHITVSRMYFMSRSGSVSRGFVTQTNDGEANGKPWKITDILELPSLGLHFKRVGLATTSLGASYRGLHKRNYQQCFGPYASVSLLTVCSEEKTIW